MPANPGHIETIARALIRRGERVLLCRSVVKGYFYLPGGHVDAGEPAAVACRREMLEETGLNATVGECLAVVETIFATLKRRHHEINIVFHVELHAPEDGAVEVASIEDEIAFEWVDRAAVVDADVRPRAIKAWLAAGGDFEDAPRPVWISDRE